jgi:restriction system protein
MISPEHRTRPIHRGRRFDLRSTAVFFALLATVLIALGLAGRAAADALEQRPVWTGALLSVGLAVAVGHGRGRLRRRSAARLARRAAEALERGTTTALEDLEHTAVIPRDGSSGPPSPPGAADGVLAHDALSPEEFEQAVAGLLERDGCSQVEVVGGAGDLGADVVALAPDGRRLVVQCKRYGEENKVGSQDLQRFGGTCFTVHEADLAVVVTTGDFTAPALEYAGQCGIVCVDGRALIAWCEGNGPTPWAGWDRREE